MLLEEEGHVRSNAMLSGPLGQLRGKLKLCYRLGIYCAFWNRERFNSSHTFLSSHEEVVSSLCDSPSISP